MKELFNRMSDSIKTTYSELTTQSNKTIDQTRCRTELINEKNKLRKLYQKLGEYTYMAELKDELEAFDTQNINEIKDKIITNITQTLSRIEALEIQVESLVNTQKDSFETYKKDVKTVWKEKNSDFQTNGESKGIKILRFCQHCDRGNPINEEYCIHCGKKL